MEHEPRRLHTASWVQTQDPLLWGNSVKHWAKPENVKWILVISIHGEFDYEPINVQILSNRWSKNLFDFLQLSEQD